jgi:hypothetical protein
VISSDIVIISSSKSGYAAWDDAPHCGIGQIKLREIPTRHWRPYDNAPLPTPAEAMQQPDAGRHKIVLIDG